MKTAGTSQGYQDKSTDDLCCDKACNGIVGQIEDIKEIPVGTETKDTVINFGKVVYVLPANGNINTKKYENIVGYKEATLG